jgi:hypothetical protein
MRAASALLLLLVAGGAAALPSPQRAAPPAVGANHRALLQAAAPSTAPGSEGYVFYPGFDTTGYDLRQMNGATVAQLAAACSAEPTCWGFNSWG